MRIYIEISTMTIEGKLNRSLMLTVENKLYLNITIHQRNVRKLWNERPTWGAVQTVSRQSILHCNRMHGVSRERQRGVRIPLVAPFYTFILDYRESLTEFYIRAYRAYCHGNFCETSFFFNVSFGGYQFSQISFAHFDCTM